MTSKILFRVLQAGGVVIFAAAVLLVILYADGYRYDFKKKVFAKKGVIYFEKIPDGADLFLDGEKRAVAFPAGIAVFPAAHAVSVRKSGFYSWEKSVSVGDDEIVKFPEIGLTPVSAENFKNLDAGGALFQSFSQDGFLVFNPKLHFVKKYPFGDQGKSRLYDWTSNFAFRNLHEIGDGEFVGVNEDNRAFFYDAENQKSIIFEDMAVKNIRRAGSKLFAAGVSGEVMEMQRREFAYGDGKLSASVFFKLPELPVDEILDAQKDSGHFLFLLKTRGEKTLAIAKSDGTVAMQIEGVDSAFIDGTDVHYSKGAELFVRKITSNNPVFSGRDNAGSGEGILRLPLPQPIVWMSRVGETFQILMLMQNYTLNHCDEDAENCHTIITAAAPLMAASDNRLNFAMTVDSYVVLIDFAEEKSFPQKVLQELVSGIFEGTYF